MRTGIVYTETIMHAAAERFAAEVPFQIVIIDLAGGGRITARTDGETLRIGDTVDETESRSTESGSPVPYFKKS